jgi:hypothetical protein
MKWHAVVLHWMDTEKREHVHRLRTPQQAIPMWVAVGTIKIKLSLNQKATHDFPKS